MTLGGQLPRYAALSVALSVAGVVAFGVVHAIAIQPIWNRLPSGIPFALAAAVPVVWLWHELQRTARWGASPAAGIWFGVLCWTADIPATAFTNLMRVASAPLPRPEWVDWVAALIAIAAGALIFGQLGASRRAVAAGGTAILVLFVTGGGAVPVVNSGRAAGLWVGFLFVKAVGGLLLAAGYRFMIVPRTVDPTHQHR